MGISEGWEAIHSSRAWGGYPSEPVIRFVARNYYGAEARKAVKILDYGCGAGSHTWFLAKEGFDVYAFDGAPSAVKRARQVIKEMGLSADIRIMDGTNLAYSDGMFDCVVDGACIYANRLQDIKVMYCEAYRVLKAGGKLLTTCFSYKTTGYGSGEELELDTYKNIRVGSLAHHDTVAHFWTNDTITEVLRDTGFVDIKIDSEMRTDGKNLVDLLVVSAMK